MDQFEILQVRSEISEAVLRSFAAGSTLVKKPILEGGGAMRFVYDSPRHTSDLDFLLHTRPWIYNEILEALKEEVESHDPTLSAWVKPISYRLIECWYSSRLHDFVRARVKVDVKVRNVEGLQYQATEGRFSPLLVEIPSQIFAKKILATLENTRLGREVESEYLFDLGYLANNLNATSTIDEIRRTARIYHEEYVITQDLIQRVVDYIEDPSNHQNFIDEINATLSPEVASRYLFDEEYFKRRADQFRQYLES